MRVRQETGRGPLERCGLRSSPTVVMPFLVVVDFFQ